MKREGCLTGVFRGKGIERKTNGGNIKPAKTKVSLADLTFPCACVLAEVRVFIASKRKLREEEKWEYWENCFRRCPWCPSGVC